MSTVRMQVVVHSSASDVWAVAGKFDSVSEWHPAIKKVDLSADGKVRTLHMPDGSTSDERLLSRDDKGMQYSYEIVDPGGPIASFNGKFKVEAFEEEKAVVTWEGDFKAAPGVPEDRVKDMLGGIFHAAVPGLKQRFNG